MDMNNAYECDIGLWCLATGDDRATIEEKYRVLGDLSCSVSLGVLEAYRLLLYKCSNLIEKLEKAKSPAEFSGARQDLINVNVNVKNMKLSETADDNFIGNSPLIIILKKKRALEIKLSKEMNKLSNEMDKLSNEMDKLRV